MSKRRRKCYGGYINAGIGIARGDDRSVFIVLGIIKIHLPGRGIVIKRKRILRSGDIIKAVLVSDGFKYAVMKVEENK